MFLERLLLLCNEKHTDISNVLRALGLSTSKGTAWRNGSIPNGEILLKLASYFGVSTDYLLGNTDEPTPAGQKEKADIQVEIGLDEKTKRLLAIAADGTPEEVEKIIEYAAFLRSQRDKR